VLCVQATTRALIRAATQAPATEDLSFPFSFPRSQQPRTNGVFRADLPGLQNWQGRATPGLEGSIPSPCRFRVPRHAYLSPWKARGRRDADGERRVNAAL
jgi:hypothetical protein